jgi:hypothetical protein
MGRVALDRAAEPAAIREDLVMAIIGELQRARDLIERLDESTG